MVSTFARTFAATGFAQMLEHLGEAATYHPAEPGDGPVDVPVMALVVLDRTPDDPSAESTELAVTVQIAKSAIATIREDADFVTIRGERYRVQRIASDAGGRWEIDCA
jgi:3-deoxy-D-manno-octulosonate 8-phosphate phosphatase KdsC-like HAD superfamily phosphatase